MPESAHDFFKRFLTFSIGPGISALIGFVSVPITTWLVAPEDFGKASMFAVFLTIPNLILFLGLDSIQVVRNRRKPQEIRKSQLEVRTKSWTLNETGGCPCLFCNKHPTAGDI